LRRFGSARFFFYSNESTEAPHVHVERADAVAKFWLDPVSLASFSRFRAHELRRLSKIVSEHRQEFLEAWHEYFGTQD
jgi:hypothetical protein